jgi:hypothetical protein
MERFYIAPRGSFAEVQHLLTRWDWFLTVKRELGLPEPGILFVPDKKYKELDAFGIPLALDNGAFQLLKADFDGPLILSDGAVQKWLSSLAEATCWHEYEWSALPDVPVHGRRFVKASERSRRIELSASLHSLFLSRFSFCGKPVAVLQGYEVDEYLYSLKLLEARGVLEEALPFLAVGSVCVRKDSSLSKLADGKAKGTASDFVGSLLSAVPRRLHFFGLHGRFVKRWREHWKFRSSDSGAGGAVFRWEIRDLKRKLGVRTDSRLDDYALSHLIQYVRSVRGLDREARETLSSMF